MPLRRDAAFVLLALGCLLAPGCQPTFEPAPGGSLSIAAAAFQPTTCHVLETGTGIELLDATGRRLELTLPPAQLEAFREIRGVPTVNVRNGASAQNVEIGLCGSLALRGEGYHAPTKRAAGGHIQLSCVGTVPVRGQLDFEGCF